MLFGKSLCFPFYYKNHCHSFTIVIYSIFHWCYHVSLVTMVLQQPHYNQQLLVIYFIMCQGLWWEYMCIVAVNPPITLWARCYHHYHHHHHCIPILHMKKLRLIQVIRFFSPATPEGGRTRMETRSCFSPKPLPLGVSISCSFLLECCNF